MIIVHVMCRVVSIRNARLFAIVNVPLSIVQQEVWRKSHEIYRFIQPNCKSLPAFVRYHHHHHHLPPPYFFVRSLHIILPFSFGSQFIWLSFLPNVWFPLSNFYSLTNRINTHTGNFNRCKRTNEQFAHLNSQFHTCMRFFLSFLDCSTIMNWVALNRMDYLAVCQIW